MASQMTDVIAPPAESARLIGRTRPVVAQAQTTVAGAGWAGAASRQAAPAPSVPLEERRLTLAEVEQVVAERELKSSAKATEKAFKEGFAAGAQSVQSAQNQWLEKVQVGIDKAVQQWETRLLELERLALAMAAQTLDQVLGCDEARASLLQQMVQHQMSMLAASTVLRVRLCERDLNRFPELMPALQARYGGGPVELVRDEQLKAGDCVFELQLGQADVGIETQRALIRAHFAGLSENDDAA